MPLTRNQSNAAAKFNSTDNAETSTSKENGEQGGASVESEPPRRDSPENCSICLGPFNNKSFTSSCAHSFCFVCLKQWSKVKAECPLCKQPFTSIFHNIRSNQHYDIYELPQQPTNMYDLQLYDFVGGTIPTFPGPTHHLLSLPQPTFDADLTLSNFSRFQFRHRRYDRYLNPLSIHGEHPYSFSGPVINPSSHISASTWPRGAEDFRREVYRRNMGPPAVILGHENLNYRLTPAMVTASAHRLQRIMPWLTRELRVLLRSHQNVRLAISIIQPLLSQVTIDSVYFFDKIVPLIGRRSRQFVQQFVAFANSALSVQAFDRKAMYRRADSGPAAPSSSSSPSSENDVVEVTDISPDIHPSSSAPGPSQSQSQNLLNRDRWHSPTPGPSWSNPEPAVASQATIVDQVSVSSESDDPVYRPDCHGSDSDESRAGSDIIFVKYDKPWNERSPIHLTSESEGKEDSEQPRKKKKSKHKKKKKESADNIPDAVASKKDKSRRLKHRNRSKGSSRAASDEERETAPCHKRRHSQSPEPHKVKKHKKSKRKEKLSDREIVDRYFAEAISQNDKQTPAATSESKDKDVSSRRKDKEKSGNSSSKDRSKRKKKSRKHSKDSHNQSYTHTYKKHPSGHKKSSNRLPESVPEPFSRHASRHSPIRGDPSGTPGRSSRHETPANYSSSRQDASSSPLPHSVVPGFQPPYLSMTDTVQHIPVNLWVSTWPTLSVSHNYPPPPSSLPNGASMPQTSNASTALPSNPTNAGPSRMFSDRLSISSNSSSDSTDSESDDAQDLHIPSLQNVHSRTKQWLETNFPDLGRPQASSISAPTSSSAASSSSTIDNPLAAQALSLEEEAGVKNSEQGDGNQEESQPRLNEKDVDVEVVSIPSEEEVVVCSSDDSCSNMDDLWVLDPIYDQSNKHNKDLLRQGPSTSKEPTSEKKGEASGSGNISTLPFQGDGKGLSSSAKSNLILPPVNKSFQPFRLQKKPALSRGKDPFFPPMTHSSDEDGEVNNIFKDQSSSRFTSSFYTSKSKDSSSFPASMLSEERKTAFDFETGSTSNLPSTSSLANSMEVNKERDGAPSGESSYGQTLKISLTTSSNATSSTMSTTTSTIFSVLPPLTSSNPSTTSVMSSGISYLPYSTLTPPTSASSSLMPCFVPPSLPPSLPLHLPFPQYPSLLTPSTQPSSIVPSLYPSGNNTTSSQSKEAEQVFASGLPSSLLSVTPKWDTNGGVLPESCSSSGSLSETQTSSNLLNIHNGPLENDGTESLTAQNPQADTESCSESRTNKRSNENNSPDEALAPSTDVISAQTQQSQQNKQDQLPPVYASSYINGNPSFESHKELPKPSYSLFENFPPYPSEASKLKGSFTNQTTEVAMEPPPGPEYGLDYLEESNTLGSIALAEGGRDNNKDSESQRQLDKSNDRGFSLTASMPETVGLSVSGKGNEEHDNSDLTTNSGHKMSNEALLSESTKDELPPSEYSQYLNSPLLQPTPTAESQTRQSVLQKSDHKARDRDSTSSYLQDSNYYWSSFGKSSTLPANSQAVSTNNGPSKILSTELNTDSTTVRPFDYSDSLSNIPLQEAVQLFPPLPESYSTASSIETPEAARRFEETGMAPCETASSLDQPESHSQEVVSSDTVDSQPVDSARLKPDGDEFTGCKSDTETRKPVLPFTDFLASSCESNTGSDSDD